MIREAQLFLDTHFQKLLHKIRPPDAFFEECRNINKLSNWKNKIQKTNSILTNSGTLLRYSYEILPVDYFFGLERCDFIYSVSTEGSSFAAMAFSSTLSLMA